MNLYRERVPHTTFEESRVGSKEGSRLKARDPWTAKED